MDISKIFKTKFFVLFILTIVSGLLATMFMYGGLETLTGLISGMFVFLGVVCYLFCFFFLVFTIVEMIDFL